MAFYPTIDGYERLHVASLVCRPDYTNDECQSDRVGRHTASNHRGEPRRCALIGVRTR